MHVEVAMILTVAKSRFFKNNGDLTGGALSMMVSLNIVRCSHLQ